MTGAGQVSSQTSQSMMHQAALQAHVLGVKRQHQAERFHLGRRQVFVGLGVHDYSFLGQS